MIVSTLASAAERSPIDPSPNAQAFYGWRVVAASAVALSMSIGPLLVYSFSLFVKPLTAEFGWTRGEVSVGSTLINLLGAVVAPMMGRLLDRWGSRRIMLLGHAGLGTTAVLLSLLTPHLWHFYLLYGLAGVIGAGSSPVPYARLVAQWFVRRRGTALGIVMAGVGAGSFAVPLLTAAAMAAYGWRGAYLLIGLLAVVVPVPLILVVMRESPAVTQKGAAPEGMSRRLAMRSGLYWRMTAAFFIVAMCSNAVLAHLSPLLVDAGMPSSAAALAISIFGLSAIVGRVGTGWLVDRIFAGRVAAVLFSGLAIGMALLAYGRLGYAASVLIGLALGAEVDIMPYLISRYFGFLAFGEIYGFTFSAFTLGMAIGPVVMGYGFDLAGGYRAPIGLLVCVLTLAIGIVWRLPEERRVTSAR